MYRTKEKVSPCSTHPLAVRGQVAGLSAVMQTRTAHIIHTRITHPSHRRTHAHTPRRRTHTQAPTLHRSPGVLLREQVGSFGSHSSCGSCEFRSLSADPVTRPVLGGLVDRALPRGPVGLCSRARSPRAPAWPWLTFPPARVAPASQGRSAGPSRHVP